MVAYWINFAKKVGFRLASSIFLTRKMVSFLDVDTARHIIELWAWDGRVTREILLHMHPDAKIDIFEIDEAQIGWLHALFDHDNRVSIHTTSAAHIDEIFTSASIDAVISTLPLGSISRDGVDHILRSIFTVLKAQGQYIQYQYWMVNRGDVKKYFTIDSTVFEPRNACPAWIYCARKTRENI